MTVFEGQVPGFLQPNRPTTPLFDDEGDIANPEQVAQQQFLNSRRTQARQSFLGTSVPNVARAQGAGSLTDAISTFASAGLTPAFGAGPFVSQLRAPQFQSGGAGPQRGASTNVNAGLRARAQAAQAQVGGNATVAAVANLSRPATNSRSRVRQ